MKTISIKNDMIVHFINVGQGDSTLIQVNNKNLLIDSGPKESRNNLLNYLESLNIKTLDFVIATHPHEDHIGNMDKIIKKYTILNFYAPKVESTTNTFEKMIDALKSKGLKINVIKRGVNSINLGKNTKVTIFTPIENHYENLNNYSPVIKIEYGEISFLFTGDAEKEIEKTLLLKKENLKSDVLKVGHHGSSTSTTESFLKEVNPSIAIISVGDFNSYNHPNESVLKRLEKNNTTIYQTNKNNTIIIGSNGKSLTKY
ncbi:MBL fold metallo-hydrolase [Clostridium sp. YB-6]|uniref:MBL fold metallo-hydrolase n=2 Tax=Clostridium weizhouense TaxID=2859781 RepID=A0ABS7ARK8_9CLOT|nr:MBL fold metallo-hydrolase [Clostridium weizhouense]